jgi:O-succinylbenzoic acid--CoA ligase
VETPTLDIAAFWESGDTHIAVPPDMAEPTGLRDFVHSEFGHSGWCLFQTSGTTGERKWAALTKEAFLISAAAMNEHCQMTAADRWMIALPEHHVGGFAINARAWRAGSPVMRYQGKWDPIRFHAECEDGRATAVSLVPTQVHDLVTAGLRAPERLRLVLVGGGLLRGDLAQRARELGWRVRTTYAMTETASTVACSAIDGDTQDALEVLPHWIASEGPDGLLMLKGPALAKGYICATPQGWTWQALMIEDDFATRDRVSLWREGARQWMRFIGRAGSFVKILGELVAIDALEPLWQKNAATVGITGRLALVAVPDARQEARLVLCADATIPDSHLGSLMESTNAEVRAFERVSEIMRVSDWPLTDLGKVIKTELERRWLGSAPE